MGVPGFYSWLTRRYPMIKHMISTSSLPAMDYLYLDMNGIIYKCVRDDSVIFKSQLQPKQLQQIWIQIFNYINMIVQILKPRKMIVLALDGVAPRCKMNNQRSRRFRSAQDYKDYIGKLQDYTQQNQSQQNFKNNSISPGTSFMHQLNNMLHFFINKKIQEDDYWKSLSIVLTGSDTPGEGEHKIMEFVRANSANFLPQDSHCFYGADADLIMLGLTLPINNACIIREQYVVTGEKVQIMSSRKQKQINFELIYLSILKECLDLQYSPLKGSMKVQYDINKIARDFVFLFFFIGNDFLPRIYAYNIRQKSIDKLIQGFKDYLKSAQNYITQGDNLNLTELLRLLSQVAKYQQNFFEAKQTEYDKFFNQQKQKFQDEIQRLFATKIKMEQQTLLGLKQMYSNQDGSGKTNFYKNYFQIDPTTNPEQMWTVLAYYVYGLKFVYQYYFKQLASWSWYYPYYFAPLLTDIQYYLGCLLAQGTALPPFQRDAPFQPFKQLLCILPKQSAQLLPKNFQWLVLSAESPLRSPLDYYPDNVQTVPYGTTRAHQAISLIPYLDQQTICEAYNKQLLNTQESDLIRNKNKKSTLYQYNYTSQAIQIKSPFPSLQNFNSKAKPIQIELFTSFKWKTSGIKHNVSEGQQNLLKMPSLKMRQFQIKILYNNSMRTILRQKYNQKYRLGSIVFFGYPNQHSGQILGVISARQFTFGKQFNMKQFNQLERLNYSIEDCQKRTAQVFADLKQSILNSRYKCSYYECVDISNTDTFLFIVQTHTFIRSIEGQFRPVYEDCPNKSYLVIPASITSQKKIYQTTKVNHKFSSLQDQFRIDQQVLVCHSDNKLCGAKAKVIGYVDKKIKVQLIQNPHFNKNQQKSAIVNILSTQNDIYFSLRFAAEIIGMKYDQLQQLLGNINVLTPTNSKLPPSIDIGLNFINRKQQMIVPNLIRINYRQNMMKVKDNPFKFIQLSIRAIELLLNYKRKFPQIIQFISNRFVRLITQSKQRGQPKINWDQPIKAEHIYPQDSSRNLMKIYLWLIEQEETHMPASSIYSKKVDIKRIQQLKQYFQAHRDNQPLLKKKQSKIKDQYIIDPNFLFSHRLSQLGFLYLSKKPKQHQVGDIVICLTPEFFGHYGAIVGIDDNKFQVHFCSPSFGKNDLGGLCQNLWGGKFEFRQLLNLQLWPQLFIQRRISTKPSQKLGWIQAADYFYPKYKTKPISQFKQIQQYLNHNQTKKYFSQQLIEQINKVKNNLKQSQIQEGYIVVDNNREDHKYKYNKKITFVQKKQIQQTVQQIKQTQKKIQKGKLALEKEKDSIIHKDLAEERQVIQNKAAQGQKITVVGQEQDGDDIFG